LTVDYRHPPHENPHREHRRDRQGNTNRTAEWDYPPIAPILPIPPIPNGSPPFLPRHRTRLVVAAGVGEEGLVEGFFELVNGRRSTVCWRRLSVDR
jgi:hypothetical protein